MSWVLKTPGVAGQAESMRGTVCGLHGVTTGRAGCWRRASRGEAAAFVLVSDTLEEQVRAPVLYGHPCISSLWKPFLLPSAGSQAWPQHRPVDGLRTPGEAPGARGLGVGGIPGREGGGSRPVHPSQGAECSAPGTGWGELPGEAPGPRQYMACAKARWHGNNCTAPSHTRRGPRVPPPL